MGGSADLGALPRELREAVTGRRERRGGLWRLSVAVCAFPLAALALLAGLSATWHYENDHAGSCWTGVTSTGEPYKACNLAHKWRVPDSEQRPGLAAGGGFAIGSSLWLDRLWRRRADDVADAADERRGDRIRLALSLATTFGLAAGVLLGWPTWLGLLGLGVPLLNLAWFGLRDAILRRREARLGGASEGVAPAE